MKAKKKIELDRVKEQIENIRSQLKADQSMEEKDQEVLDDLRYQLGYYVALNKYLQDLPYYTLVHEAIIALRSSKSAYMFHKKQEALLRWREGHHSRKEFELRESKC